MDADIAVIGLGSVGSMALWQLAKQGVKVIGFEQFGVGHDRSAAGGESRLFRTAYKEGAEYIPLLKESQQLWRQLEAETENSILTLNGGLTIGNRECELVENVLKCVNELEIDYQILEYKDACMRYPQHKLRPDEIMILDRESGFIRPELAVVSAVTRAKELGAKVASYTRVEEIEQNGDGILICANGKEYRVKKVLITTGPWASKFVPKSESTLEATRLTLSWYQAKNIQLYTPENFPIFIRHRDGVELYGAPSLDNCSVKIAMFHMESARKTVDPDFLERAVGLNELVGSEVIEEFFTGLHPDPVRLNAYMDAFTPDGHGMVGETTDLPNVVVAAGFSGHGFKLAPVLGKISVDILLDGKTNFSIEHLDPSRFQTSLYS